MSKKRILIVEDTRIIALSIKSDVEGLGYSVIDLADSGEAAVNVAIDTKPDLILMDINIKGNIDGIEAGKIILSQIDVPIVFLTAYTDINTTSRAKKIAPYGYIIKPYEEKTLEITIDFALYKHQNQKIFNTILNESNDGIAITDTAGKIINKNILSSQLLDLENNETICSAITDFSSDFDTSSYISEITEKGKKTVEIVSDDNTGAIELKGCPITYKEKNALVHIIRDFTEKKETERKIINASLETEERDKQRFAEELHDGIGPLLSTLKNYLNTLNDTLETDFQKDIVGRIFQINEEILVNIKDISYDLRPHLLRNFGFISAINKLIKRTKDAWPDINIIFDSDTNERFNEKVEVALFRITGELINNTLKYAEADQICIFLKKDNDAYFFEYRDNGKGFDFNREKDQNSGMGLINIKNRVNTMPATMKFFSQPGKGISLIITIQKNVMHN